jgi:cytochrome c-type biogenesis protein CcmH/NrfG
VTPEQRVESFRKIVDQRPAEPFARYSLAMSLRAIGRAEEAALEFEELLRRNPEYVPTYLMLGQVLEGLGRAADAAAAYERGIGAAEKKNDQHARSELEQALGVLRAQGAR